MALLDYLIWKDNGLYYLQSWLQEKFYHFVRIYDKKQTPFSQFFSAKWEVMFFFQKKSESILHPGLLTVNVLPLLQRFSSLT